MSHDPKKTVTIEDLLRIKRAERPPAEFWAQWDRELRTKQLAAIVEERPWWQVNVPVYVRRMVKWQLPVGAAAVMALTFITLKNYQDQSGAETNLATVESISVSTVQPSVAVVETHTASATVAQVSTAPAASEQRLSAETAQPTESASHAQKALVSLDTPISSMVAIPTTFGSVTTEVAPATLSTEPTKEPLTRIATIKDARRARLLDGAMGGNYAASASGEMARTRERIASRLNEDRFYAAGSGRLGTSGDRLSLRF